MTAIISFITALSLNRNRVSAAQLRCAFSWRNPVSGMVVFMGAAWLCAGQACPDLLHTDYNRLVRWDHQGARSTPYEMRPARPAHIVPTDDRHSPVSNKLAPAD